MANTIENMKHAAERQAVSVAVDGLFKHIKHLNRIFLLLGKSAGEIVIPERGIYF